MSKAKILFTLARDLALATEGFFDTKGPGKGNHSTNNFIAKLGELATREFGEDFSERNICGENSLAVDFYFPDEATIVEIALGIRNPNTEYEKDILKAVMSKRLDNNVNKLVLIAKPGGQKKCNQPGRLAVKKWLGDVYSIELEVWDLEN